MAWIVWACHPHRLRTLEPKSSCWSMSGRRLWENRYRHAGHRRSIVGVSAMRRLPAVYPLRVFTVDGGLMSYGTRSLDLYMSVASDTGRYQP
jgi:hypothetical protein